MIALANSIRTSSYLCYFVIKLKKQMLAEIAIAERGKTTSCWEKCFYIPQYLSSSAIYSFLFRDIPILVSYFRKIL